MCAHDEVDRPAWERITEPVLSQRDVDHRRILDEHRDDDVAIGAYIGDRRGGPCAGTRERGHLRSDCIEDREIVATAEDAAGHARAHAAKTDETDSHLCNLFACARSC